MAAVGALRWLLSQKLALWIVTLAASIALAIKGWGASSPFANTPDYVVNLSVRAFFITTRSYLSQLVFRPENTLNTTFCVLLLLAVVAIALISRRRHLMLCGAMILVLPLPVNFIAPRDFFVMYIPFLAWAIFAATSLVEGRDWMWRTFWHRTPLAAGAWEPERVFLFLLAAYGLWNVQSRDTYRSFEWVDPSQRAIHALRSGLVESCPQLQKGGRVLLLSDPFDKGDFMPVFVVRLFFDNPEIQLDRVKNSPEQSSQPNRGYDCTLQYDGQRFRAAARASYAPLVVP